MLKSCRNTYVIVVTTALSAKGCLIIELVLEIVLAQVPQGCAHLSMLQLFLTRLSLVRTIFLYINATHDLEHKWEKQSQRAGTSSHRCPSS